MFHKKGPYGRTSYLPKLWQCSLRTFSYSIFLNFSLSHSLTHSPFHSVIIIYVLIIYCWHMFFLFLSVPVSRATKAPILDRKTLPYGKIINLNDSSLSLSSFKLFVTNNMLQKNFAQLSRSSVTNFSFSTNYQWIPMNNLLYQFSQQFKITSRFSLFLVSIKLLKRCRWITVLWINKIVIIWIITPTQCTLLKFTIYLSSCYKLVTMPNVSAGYVPSSGDIFYFFYFQLFDFLSFSCAKWYLNVLLDTT